MSLWRSMILSIAGLGLAACVQAPAPVPIGTVVVFGDSLSDVGTYQAATRSRTNPGKFTVNPSNIWVEDVAAHYGQTVRPDRSLTMDRDASSGVTRAVGTARVIGGNGYAEGGARVAHLPSQSGIGNNRLVAPVASQLERYLASNGRFSPDQLVIIDGGTNDIYAQFSAMCWGTDDNGIGAGKTTQAIADREVERAATELIAVVEKAKANGAGVVLVAGAIDWTDAPFGRKYLAASELATGCSQSFAPGQVKEWTASFNRTLADGVGHMPGVVVLDFASPVNAVLADPGRFGITNATEPACTNKRPTTSAVFCTGETLAAPDAGSTYLWSDTFHPGPRLHGLIADEALRLLEPVAAP